VNVEDIDLPSAPISLSRPVETHIVGLQFPQRVSDGHVHTLLGVSAKIRDFVLTVLMALVATVSSCWGLQDSLAGVFRSYDQSIPVLTLRHPFSKDGLAFLVLDNQR
jgi:hypothetical protein